ncbi:SHOCT domain-containing protein [Marinobacterium stanieri]|uniref:SHOCT domain-containing protein n=1 Tax=Marinobacterium stanieri TaxID=49186 RepID=UPI003A90CAF8
MWGDYQVHGWGWMLFGGVHMILFWLLMVLLIVALVKWLKGPSSSEDRRAQDALDILDQRLARGEIDMDTYRKLKQELQQR